jgi:hypothetical protein
MNWLGSPTISTEAQGHLLRQELPVRHPVIYRSATRFRVRFPVVLFNQISKRCPGDGVKPIGGTMGKVLKYGAILALVAAVIVNFQDIKRYIRISTM